MDLENVEYMFNSSYNELKKISKELKEESLKLTLEKEEFYKELGKINNKKEDKFSSKISLLDVDIDFLREINEINKKENDFLNESKYEEKEEDEDINKLFKNIIEKDEYKKSNFIGNDEDKSKNYMGINLYFCLNRPSYKLGFTKVDFEEKKEKKFYGENNKNFEEYLKEKHGFTYCSEQLIHSINKNFFNYLIMTLEQFSKLTLLGGKQEVIVGNRFVIEIRKSLSGVYDIEILEYGIYGIKEKDNTGNFYFTI